MPAYHARAAFEAEHVADGTLITNVFHFEVDTLSSPPNWDSIANDIGVWLGTLYTSILTTHERLVQIVVSDENYPGSTHGQGVSVSGVTGARTVADQGLSPGLCAVASWKTSVAKRYARGRTFMPPALGTATCDPAGTWLTTNAYFTACQALVTALVAGHAAGSTSYVFEIFSKHQEALGLTPFSFPVKTGVLSQKQHFLRSRTTAP